MVLSFVLLVAIMAITWTIVLDLKQEQIVILPLAVPPSLEKAGITGEIVARWTRDEIRNVQNTASTTKQRVLIISSEDLPDITVGDSGFTLQSVISVSRRLLSFPTKQVAGEIVIRDANSGAASVVADCDNHKQTEHISRFKIRVRTSFGKATHWTACGDDMEQLAQAAAHQVLEQANPYVLASYFFEIGRRNLDDKSTMRSKELAEEIIRNRPREERKWAMNLLGLIYANNKDPERAITQYAEIERQGIRFVPALINWGVALTQLNPPQHAAAIEKYSLAAKIEPQNSAAFINWGIALTKLNPPQFGDAIEKYRTAIGIDPLSEDALYNWAVILSILGRHEAAIEKYRATIEINPNHANAHNNWGIALQAIVPPQKEAAIEKFRTATEINPKNAAAFLNWGNILVRLDPPQTEAAIEKYRSAINADPQNSVAFESLGLALTLLKPPQYQTAIDKYRIASVINPKQESAFYNWGVALAKLKPPQHEAAIEKYQRTTEIDPRHARAFYNWGVSLAKLNPPQYEAAIEKYRRATEIDPEFVDAFQNWSVDLHSLGRNEQSDALFLHAECLRSNGLASTCPLPDLD